MKFVSTRDKSKSVTLSQAMLTGLASDGGLFVPESFPKIDCNDFSGGLSYADFSYRVLHPFFMGDQLESSLQSLCQEAFDFPLYLKKLYNETYILELFHGPTLSFKDFGARFLASSISQLASEDDITILVATSGDTGSAVAAAFYKKPKTHVIVLFPHKKISARQQQQITCWGDNVTALAVEGSFDDCQKIVKDTFARNVLRQICTANSINIGRLLPQMCYYAYVSMKLYREKNIKTNFVVPSGNLGNVTAAFWAKECGFPIADIVVVSNSNQSVLNYIERGIFEPKNTIETLANAMDVGNPSNFERLSNLFPSFEKFAAAISSYSVSDKKIKESIAATYADYQLIICPHTATAMYVKENLLDDKKGAWIIVSTAHPAKFESVVEPILSRKVPVPQALNDIDRKAAHFDRISPDSKLF